MRLAQLIVFTLFGCAVAGDPSSVVPRPIMRAPGEWSRWEFVGPAARRFATATASPSGVFVVGGLGRDAPCADAWRWDGARWIELSRDGAPAPRVGHVSVWAGDRLCVWGGGVGRSLRDDGACWRDGAWRPMSRDGAPTPRTAAAAVWTGRALMVFGGRDAEGDALGDGALYDPVADRWEPLADGGPKPRWGAVLALDGARERVALWGGAGEALAQGDDDAAWLSLREGRWSPLSTEDAPVLRAGPQSVTLDGAVVVLADGPARLDLGAGRWRRTDARDAPSHRLSATAAAAPGGAVFWGGLDADGPRGDGARYDLDADRWTALPLHGAPSPRSDALGFWDGRALRVLWGVDARGLCDDAYTLVL